MKIFSIILFIVMCLAQWIVPGKMIYDSERVVTEGDEYKFKTAPIDPSDPFRGKYITLNFESNFISFEDSVEWQGGQEVFVTFKTDSAGFAIPEAISSIPPASGSFLRTTVDYVTNYEGYKVWINFPFNRFYMEESKASDAERVYWEAQRDSTQVAHALVSIGTGQAVIKNVFINDVPIVDIVKKLNQDEK